MLLLVLACAVPAPPTAEGPLQVPLRWVRGRDRETWEVARAGLLWSLANLGALPPADGAALGDVSAGEDEATFVLDLGAAGLPDAALPHVEAAAAPLLASEEIAATGAMDVGRFLMGTVYAPGRYYTITGACATAADWQAARLGPDPTRYDVTTSQLVSGDRRVLFAASPDGVGGIALLAEEGEGSLQAGDFSPYELETVDVMANGQQRYAVYGEDGVLRPYGTVAGQPGRCMWCHETTIQRGTAENEGTQEGISHAAFLEEAAAMDALMDAHQDALSTELDTETHEVHAWAELLALQFLEPTPARVAREWGVDVADVEALGLPTHESWEYPELGPLLRRADVDAASPRGFAAAPVAADFRDPDPLLSLEGAEALEGCR